ncbi:MAG: hypothetical protein EON93_17325 [Burkholderiales bacterium]|nr:MAG: hypothetical protein EON93_17325 [Burkholderiales bacterium]
MKFAMAAAAAALMLAACGGENAAAPTDGAAPAAGTPAAPAANNAIQGPIAGEWEVTVTAAGMALPAQKICYEKQMTMEEAQKMQQDAGMTCSEQTYAPDGKSGHSVCTMQGMTITSDYTVTGDFNSSYTMEMKTSMDPAPPGMPNPSTTAIKMDRLGDCSADTPRAPTP